jgi:hypothetical protein
MTLQALAATTLPMSETMRAANAPTRSITMSQRLWDFNWVDCLPWTHHGVSCEVGTFDDAEVFMREHYGQIFGDVSDRFLVEPMTEGKRRFCNELDVLVLRASDGRVVGICLGQPTDWSTYYFRSFAILPELRELGFASAFQKFLHASLSSSGKIARWEIETSTANAAMMRTMLSAGFVISAMINSERWGSVVRLTRFITKDADTTFRRQFVSVPVFGRDQTSK